MVRAPFSLITITTDTSTGQAAGEKWYLAPLRHYRTKVIDSTRVVGWRMKMFFGPSIQDAQYIGQITWYAGKSHWHGR